MSTTVDQRVVEMRFDNKQFESNVSTTMSTLEKLKQKLRLTESTKGLTDLGNAAKKVDLSQMGTSAEKVGLKFNAMYTMADQALRNIVNSAMNAGKRITKALTIDPIMTGFSEYETKINSIQTIMSNTASKGTTMEDVTRVINELNTYADKTIYNFAEMTRNIGTFTAAGVGLEDSAAAIQGIANLAAASGSTSQQASTAMYQLSQALAAGTVKLMDWNSVVNAGMGGEKFQEALKATARDHGIAVDEMIEKNGSFRESLQEGWITADVLNETLRKFTVEGAKEYADAMVASGQYTEAQAEALIKEAQAMEDAATKVKTFSQLWDTMKESVQSGWGQTWELIIGDFEEAREFLSGLSEKFGEIIGKISDNRNNLLEGALGSKWDKLTQKITDAGIEVSDFEKKVKSVARDHGVDIDALVEKYGSLEKAFASGKISSDILKEAIRSMGEELGGTNEKTSEAIENLSKIERILGMGSVGDDVKNLQQVLSDLGYSLDQFGVDGIIGDETTKAIKEFQKAAGLKVDGIVGEDTIKALEKAVAETEKLDENTNKVIDSWEDLADEVTKASGRELLLDTFTNLIDGAIKACKALAGAWKAIFPPITAQQLYNAIEAVHGFSEKLVMSNATMYKLQDTFKGIFAVIDIVATLVGGPLKWAFEGVKTVLGMFDLNILDVTAAMGRAVVKLRDWIDEHNIFTKGLEKVAPFIKNAIEGFLDWIDVLKQAEDLPKAIAEGIMTGLKTAVEFIGNLFSDIRSAISEGFSGAPGDLISGFINGVWSGIQTVAATIRELASMILAEFRAILGIHSPSTETYADGQNFVQGFADGILAAAEWVIGAVSGLASSIIEAFRKGLSAFKDWAEPYVSPVIDWITEMWGKAKESLAELDFGDIIAGGLSGGLLATLFKIAKTIDSVSGVITAGMAAGAIKIGKIIDSFVKPFDALGDVIAGFKGIGEEVKKVVESFGKVIKAQAFKTNTEGLRNIALSILILAGAVAVLAMLPEDSVERALVYLVAIAGIFAVLAVIVGLAGKLTSGIGGLVTGLTNIAKISALIVAIGASTILMAGAIAIIASLNSEKATQALNGLVVMAGAITLVLMACGQAAKGADGKAIGKLSKVITRIGIAMLLMAAVAKIIASMSWEEMGRAGAGIGAFALIISGLVWATKLAGGKTRHIGKMITGIAVALLAMTVVAKIIASMSWEEMGKAGVGIFALGGIITGLVAATRLAGNGELKRVGTTLMGIGIAMGFMAIVAKMIASMSWEEMGRAGVGIVALAGIITGLVASTKLAGPGELKRLSTTLMAMSIAIGILATIAIVMGMIEIEALAKGVGAVAILSAMMALMVASTRGAPNDIKGTMIGMAIAIGVMAVAVTALSMIDATKLAGATACLAVLMGMFALMEFAAGKMGKAVGTIIVMTIAVGLLAALLWGLTEIPNTDALLPVAASLSLLLLSVSAALLIVSKIATSAPKALVGILLLTAMIIPMGLFVGALYLLSNISNATENVYSLIILMTAMTALLGVLTIIGAFATTGAPFLGVVALTTLIVPMLLFIGALAIVSCISNATENVHALVTLMTAMTILLGILTVVGVFGVQALTGVVMLSALAIATGLFVGVLAIMSVVPDATANANLLIGLMTSMTRLLVILAPIAPLALIGVAALAGLTLLMTGLGLLAVGIGALMTKFPALQDFLNTGIPVLNQLAGAVGSMVGNLVNGFLTASTANLPDIATSLSDFMTNLQPFLSGVKMADESVLTGVGYIAGAIAALGAANVIESVTSFMSGGQSFADLGTELSDFMTNVQPFLDGLSGVDPASLTAVKALADAILTLTGTNLLDSLTSWIAGDTSLADFGTELASFGPSMKTYADAVAGIDTAAVTASANAAKTLAQMAESIPNEGGLLGKIFGENSVDTFGTQLSSFGTSLKAYADSVIGIDTAAINNSVTAAQSLSDMADSIPNSGGLFADFFGDNDIGAFGTKLITFGASLVSYANSVAGLDTESISTSVGAVKNLASMADAIPDDAAMWGMFGGNVGLDEWGTKLITFGACLVSYADSVAGIDASGIDASVTAAKSLVGLANSIPEGGIFKSDLKSFGKDIQPFGTSIATYANTVASIDFGGVDASVSAGEKLIDFINSAAGLDSSGATEFKNAVNELKTTGISEFIATFKGAADDLEGIGADMIDSLVQGIFGGKESVTAVARNISSAAVAEVEKKTVGFSAAGKIMSVKLAVGILSGKGTVMAAARNLASSLTVVLRSQYSGFYSAGSYLVTGFANGISANAYKAKVKARAMALAAKQAAEDALGIASPSKVFYKIGDYTGLGFVKALGTYASKAYQVSTDVASAAKNGLTNAISNIMDTVSSGIDTQPTIRPILDLSDVNAGAGRLNNLLNFNSRVGVMANIGAIATSRAQRQNGPNDDVVSAIDKLSKRLNNIGNTYNSINGITYDDEGVVADAIHTLVRAARVEGRA